MASAYRTASAAPGFEDVLDSVSRGAPRFDDEDMAQEDVAQDGMEQEEAGRAPGLAPHARFDFLQALDGISDRQAEEPGPSATEASAAYAEAWRDAEPDMDDTAPAPDERRDGMPHDEMQARPEAAPAPSSTAEPELGPCDPASLIAELGLRVGMRRAELRSLRRAFALANHPDRLSAQRREAASRRMKVANALIDAALRRARD